MGKIVKKCAFCVVKRAGHREEFDERKAYASCYAACTSAGVKKQDAEKFCAKVLSAIKAHLRKHREIESGELFRFLVRELRKHDPKAAFLYETHRDIS
jgi:transcriptional regulator NrdR family protein